MKTRCKFKCVSVTQHEGDFKSLEFNAVVGGSEENKEFFKWSPNGQLKFGCVNPAVQFEAGKEYYIDISLAE